MTILLLFLFVLLALIFGYYFYRKNALINRMSNAVHLVKLGLFRRLKQSYLTNLESPEATLLADAVTALVFSEIPTAPHELQFREEHRDRIEREARRLSQDKHICDLITQAARTQAILAHIAKKEGVRDASDRFERLKDLGILVTGGDAPAPDTFISAARTFSEGNLSPRAPASFHLR